MNKKRICLVASSGGHIEELMQLDFLRKEYDYSVVVPRTKWTEKIEGRKYYVKDLDRRNKITKIFSFVFMVIEQFPIFFKEKPDVVVTTGAAVAIPIGIISKIFNKKLIYIESICRVKTRSKTGNFFYNKADLFIVQWPEQLKCYPDAIYGGKIY